MWKPNVTPQKEVVAANKGSAGKFIDPNSRKVKLMPWSCPSCTVLNEGSNKLCHMCQTKQPDRNQLSLAITVPTHHEYATKPLLLTDLKHSMSLAFLRDLCEAKTGINESKQLITYKGIVVEGEPDDYLLTLLHGVNPVDVIPLTLQIFDPSASAKPKSGPALRKKPSRSKSNQSTPNMSRQGSTEENPGTKPDEDMDGWADDGDGDGDTGGGDWGDDDEMGGGDWDGEEEINEDEEIKENDKLALARKAAKQKLLAGEEFEEEQKGELDPFDAPSPTAAAAAASSSSAAMQDVTPTAAASSSSSTTYESWTAKTKTYILRKPAQLEAKIQRDCEDLAELLSLTPDEAGVVSRCWKDPWNSDKIQTACWGDTDKFRTTAGLGPFPDEDDAVGPDEMVSCETCADDIPAKESMALNCKHRFCNPCWTQWISAEFDKGPTCIKTRCQGYKCQVIIPYHTQLSFLPIEKQEKLTRWILDDYVAWHNKDFRWCPFTNCVMNAQRLEGVHHVGGIDCTCAHSWCFDCLLEDHRPASCEDAKKWNDKNNSDAENVNWILANTKVCPKCQVNIEKNQGCNHMTCRKCNHQFCWLCKADWSNHTNCANYNANGTSKETVAVENAQNALKKYMHYWSRFDNHAKSIKFAEKTRKQAEERMQELQTLKGSGLLDVQFLVDSVNAVIANKRILQWLYVYAYYFEAPEGSSDRALFEMHQAQLEKFTDELHGMCEKPMEELVKPETRIKMISFVSTVAKFRKGVIDAVESSNEKHRAQATEGSPPPTSASSTTAAAAASTTTKSASKKKSRK